LGVDGYYRTLASDAWAMVPAPVVADEPAEEVVADAPAEGGERINYLWGKLKPLLMEHLQQRLDALKQQEANLLMQLDEVRVLDIKHTKIP
jgi:hypothetical protein